MKQFKKYALAALLVCCLLLLTSCAVKITFDIGDATLVSGELKQTYNEETPIVPPVVEKEGYIFVGWEPDPATVTEKATITPKWVKAYTVTFDPQGGTAADAALLSQTIAEGTAATAPVLTREGFAFDGWDADFSAVTSDITVKAAWKKLHKVIFNTNGGVDGGSVDLVQYVVDGEDAVVPHVSRKNFEFKGWNLETTNVTEERVIIARWERKTFTGSELHSLINPATVEIKTYRTEGGSHMSTGSGFFIDENGTLLTNYHVITNARSIKATTGGGKEYNITHVIAYDADKDIAILQADVGFTKVDFLEITPELPKTGDVVYALGSSLGLTGTFSTGIVSYVNREIDGVNFIQSTAPISSGNSGGPLVTEKGYVVGINSATYTEGQNLNLAVEISQYTSLSAVNMTVQQFFEKEATLKWWVGEKNVAETSKAGTTGQIVQDGDTVKAALNGISDKDTFMVSMNPDTEFVVFYVITKFNKPIKDISGFQYTAFVTKTDSVNDGQVINSQLCRGEVITDDDGQEYYMYIAILPAETAKEYKHIGVVAQSTDNIQYEAFFWMTSLEEMLDII